MVNKRRLMQLLLRTGREISGRNSGNINGQDTETTEESQVNTYIYVCMCVKLLQSCPTLCDPMDCSSPGSSVHAVLQARILE